MYKPTGTITILHKGNIQRLLKQPEKASSPMLRARDQLIMDLPAYMGLRTREIATLRWEYINMDDGYLYVLNSKKYHLYPLPIDWRVAKVLSRYMNHVDDASQGWVVRRTVGPVKRTAKDKPLQNNSIESVVKFWAEQAEITDWRHYNPRLLRCYFAAMWIKEKRDAKVLQTLMRHAHLSQTLSYVSRILFWEDIQREFDRIQTGPFERRVGKLNLANLVVRQCLQCPARDVCKYVDQAVESEWAEGCRFFAKIVEEVLARKIVEEQL